MCGGGKFDFPILSFLLQMSLSTPSSLLPPSCCSCRLLLSLPPKQHPPKISVCAKRIKEKTWVCWGLGGGCTTAGHRQICTLGFFPHFFLKARGGGDVTKCGRCGEKEEEGCAFFFSIRIPTYLKIFLLFEKEKKDSFFQAIKLFAETTFFFFLGSFTLLFSSLSCARSSEVFFQGDLAEKKFSLLCFHFTQ